MSDDPQPTGYDQPHNETAEAAILGACLLVPSALSAVMVRVRRDDFYRGANRKVFSAISDLYNQSLPVDLVTVQEWLSSHGDLEAVGGTIYLVELTDKVASSSNVEAYAQLVREKAQLRQLLVACRETMKDLFERQEQTSEVLDAAAERILSVSDVRSADFEGVGVGWEADFELLERSSRGEKPFALKTPLDGWNRILGGIIPGKVYVVGGRPGDGKSALCLNLASAIAQGGTPTVFFSLEMDKLQMRNRIVAAEADIDGSNIEIGKMTEDELLLYKATMRMIHARALYFYHDPYLELNQLLSLARVAISKMSAKIFVIDYLQLVRDTSRRYGSKAEETTEVCRRIAAFARAHNVAIIEAAQINRDVKEEEPKVRHLKDSGGIEEGADVVALLYDEGDSKYSGQPQVPITLIIGKNRGGTTGRFEMQFTRRFLRFESRE